MEADEWLQILAQHPVFVTTGRTHTADAESKDEDATIPRERVAIRGTDLFVAVGQEVRWINLKACKDALVRFESKQIGLKGSSDKGAPATKQAPKTKQDAVKAVPWFRLCCEALSFDIRKLVCNGSGKLLAAVGTHQTAVVVLPAPSAAGKNAALSAGGFLMASSGGGAFNAARHERPSGERPGEGIWLDCRSMLLGAMQADAGTKGKRRASAIGSSLSVSASWSVRTRVQDVLWHPLSSTDSHILVLHANGAIRMFDVSNDVDVPEQTLSLRSVKGGSSSFSMSQATAFCLGSSTAPGWARATLYVLANTGELYSMCPVLPRVCCIERDWLEDLLETTELDVREWQAEEYETSECIYTPTELVDARAAAKWVNQVLNLDKSKAAAAGGERLYLTLPSNLISPASTQGPYLFQPEPAPVDTSGYDSDDSGSSSASSGYSNANAEDASDVLYMESGCGIGLIAIAYCDAHVEVFADLEPVIAKWSTSAGRSSHPHELPVLVTLASIDLAVAPLTDGGFGAGIGALSSAQSFGASSKSGAPRQIGAVSMVADTLSPHVFFALHSRGVHRIDTGRWAKLLGTAMGFGSDEERSAALERLLFVLDGRASTPASSVAPGMSESSRGALLRSCVQCLVHTNPCSSRDSVPVVGAVVIDDIYLSYSLLTLAAPNHLVGVALPLSSASDDTDADGGDGHTDGEGEVEGGDADADEARRPRRLDLSLGAKDVIYVPRLPMPVYEVPSVLGANGASAVQQPRLVLRNDGDEGITEERLRLLGQVVGQLRGQLRGIAAAHAAMEARLELQVQEYERQRNKLSGISAGFSRHFEQMKTTQSRLERLRENGHKLGVRVDQMLRQLIDHYQPELTASERAFIREVSTMTAQVDGLGGYKEQVEQLQEKVSELKAAAKLAQQKNEKRRSGSFAPAHLAGGGDKGKSDSPHLSRTALKSIGATLDREQSDLREVCSRIADMQRRLDSISLRQQQEQQ
ncbi:hypothetical protein GQ54DRAFT_117738 [Martensiomyces pterosporus]|nr:hypothetical protein GQ54DRAFT_117738 [Martensiomyces pterosporus]